LKAEKDVYSLSHSTCIQYPRLKASPKQWNSKSKADIEKVIEKYPHRTVRWKIKIRKTTFKETFYGQTTSTSNKALKGEEKNDENSTFSFCYSRDFITAFKFEKFLMKNKLRISLVQVEKDINGRKNISQ
jgi:hypothetical protein